MCFDEVKEGEGRGRLSPEGHRWEEGKGGMEGLWSGAFTGAAIMVGAGGAEKERSGRKGRALHGKRKVRGEGGGGGGEGNVRGGGAGLVSLSCNCGSLWC